MSQLGLSPWACRHGSSGVGVAQAWCSSVRLGMLRGMFTLFYVRRQDRQARVRLGPGSSGTVQTSLPRVAYTSIMHGVQFVVCYCPIKTRVSARQMLWPGRVGLATQAPASLNLAPL